MKFLIAGLGSIGRRHLSNLAALGEKDITLFRTQRSTMPDDELAGYPVETDLEAALAKKPDAVIVSNPTALHMQVAIPAAEAGCSLFLEKPISHTMEKIDELKAALGRGDGQVLVGYQFRHHPALRQIADFLAEEAIGRALSVRAQWGEYLPDWHPWEDYRKSYSARKDLGGGVILTLSHPLDYLRWMFGDVDSLWAFVGKLSDLELEVEDTAEIGLRFSSGVIGSLHLDYNQRPGSHHIQVIGTQGSIRWENPDEIVKIYRSGSKEWEEVYTAHGFERNDMFLAQMHHFREVVRGKAEPICTLEDGIQALELSLGAIISAENGQMKSFGE